MATWGYLEGTERLAPWSLQSLPGEGKVEGEEEGYPRAQVDEAAHEGGKGLWILSGLKAETSAACR